MLRLAKVRPGDPIAASEWNALVDAIQAATHVTSDGSLSVSQGAHGTHLSVNRRLVGVPIRNDSASELPAFGVAAVKSIDASWNGPPALVVDHVGSSFERDLVVNGPTGVAVDAFGLAQSGPIVTLAYDSGTPSIGQGLGPKASQWTATANHPSWWTALGVIDATRKLVLARAEPPSQLIGQLESNVSKGSTGTVYILNASHAKISSWSVTATNLFADLTAGSSSPPPVKVALNWINGKWYMVAAECG